MDLPSVEARWWSPLPKESLWFGVFQGGGAKGVAYVGGLLALESKGQWFRSVAGSSAGAITAALVAAGFHPSELASLTRELLSAVRPSSPVDRLILHLPGVRALARYDAKGLESAIEMQLVEGVRRHGGRPDKPVTFAELQAATGMDLYVLALDAATGAPLPFRAERTPRLSVSAAVVASSAIPMAFEPRYVEVVMSIHDLGPPFRRVVDRGAWANFPAFIYEDVAFREFYELPPIPVDAKVLGFVMLGSAYSAQVSPPIDFVEDPQGHLDWYAAEVMTQYHGRRSRGTNAADSTDEDEDEDEAVGFGEQLRFRLYLLRRSLLPTLVFVVEAALIASVVMLAADLLNDQGWRRARGVLTVLFGISLLVVLWLSHRVFRALVREGRDTLLSLVVRATAPAIWADCAPGTILVWVLTSDLETTQFELSDDKVEAAVQEALDACDEQISEALATGETFARRYRRMMLEHRAASSSEPERSFAKLVPRHRLKH